MTFRLGPLAQLAMPRVILESLIVEEGLFSRREDKRPTATDTLLLPIDKVHNLSNSSGRSWLNLAPIRAALDFRKRLLNATPIGPFCHASTVAESEDNPASG